MSATTLDPRIKHIFDREAELKDMRGSQDERCQQISDHIAPTRSFTIKRQPGELRTRNLRDATGLLANKRLSAFLFGDMMSPATPWVQPRLLNRDPTSEEAFWFEQCSVKMHDRLSSAASPIAVQLYEATQDLTSFGNALTFRVPRKKGELPRMRSIALANAWWAEDGDDVVDTCYRNFTYTARQATLKYPNSGKIAEKAEKNPREVLSFVHAVEPRAHGMKGAIGSRKPWCSTIVWRDGKEIVEDTGFDRFPFQVGRFERSAGEVYGQGPGWHAMPAVFSANAMAESIIRGGELAADPILFGNPAIFGGRLDRRPGAFNPIKDNLAIYGQRMSDVIGKIDFSGDVGIGIQILEAQRELINALFYVDWLWLRVGPQMTATEVNARRDMRMRMMSPIVGRIEQEWLNPLVEEMFWAMLEGGYFPPPPRTLAREEIGFVYLSPLALAQRGAVVDAIERTFDLATKAHQFDETASMVLKSDEMLRDAARLRGVSEKRLTSPEELAKLREARAEERQAQLQMEAAKAAGSALQSGAQGLASLRQVEGALPMAA